MKLEDRSGNKGKSRNEIQIPVPLSARNTVADIVSQIVRPSFSELAWKAAVHQG